MIIQLNHPGNQKPFSQKRLLNDGNGYIYKDNNIIRLWNTDKSHYRKFICCKGKYIENINDTFPKHSELYFWGEWEGHSRFEPINNDLDKRVFPNGIHYPFHFIQQSWKQNTDPYIFGNEFKYAECKQKGQMCNLINDDLILFGTVFPSLKCFYLDTVFVVDDFESSIDVSVNNVANYTNIYREVTLEQLGTTYINQTVLNQKRIYKGKKWSQNNKSYFSFVPSKSKLVDKAGFERLRIDFSEFQKLGLSTNTTGLSYLKESSLNNNELWFYLVEKCEAQEFNLGIEFEEPHEESL